MKTLLLSNEEAAKTGFTHKAILSYAQGDFTAAGLTQSFTLSAPAAGKIIQGAARKIVTNVASPAITSLIGRLGDSADDDGFLVDAQIHAGATPVTYQAGDGALLNQAGGKVYQAADTLIYKLTAITANISTITAGEVHLYWKEIDLTKI